VIAALRGELLFKTPGQVITEVHGVGYEVNISARTYDALPAVGEECFFYVSTQVREDAITLFGFATREEKELFLLLNTVSGVGPKLALAILSGIGVAEFCEAVRGKNIARLTALSGVGKKTAQRLCMELGEKVGGMAELLPEENRKESPVAVQEGTALQDAVSALVNLGYPQQTAWQVLRRVQARDPEAAATMEVQDLIRLALQALARTS